MNKKEHRRRALEIAKEFAVTGVPLLLPSGLGADVVFYANNGRARSIAIIKWVDADYDDDTVIQVPLVDYWRCRSVASCMMTTPNLLVKFRDRLCWGTMTSYLWETPYMPTEVVQSDDPFEDDIVVNVKASDLCKL